MAGFALSIGEAGLAEFLAAVIACLEAAAAEATAAAGTILTAASADSGVATFAARKAFIADSGPTEVTAAAVVGRHGVAAIGAVTSRPFVELGVGTAGVVSVQNLVRDLEKIGQASGGQRPLDRDCTISFTQSFILHVRVRD